MYKVIEEIAELYSFWISTFPDIQVLVKQTTDPIHNTKRETPKEDIIGLSL